MRRAWLVILVVAFDGCSTRVDVGGGSSRAGGAAAPDATIEGDGGAHGSCGPATADGPEGGARCPDGVLQGDFEISSTADAASVCGCTTITGRLTVASTPLGAFSLPLLRTVGSLWVHDNAVLTTFALPALTSIDDDLMIGSRDAEVSAAGRSIVRPATSGNPALTRFLLPRLRSIGQSTTFIAVHVSGNDSLTTIELPSLETTTGTVEVLSHRSLESLSLPALTSIRLASPGVGLVIVSNTALTSVALPLLASVDGMPNGSSVDLVGNSSLATFTLPALASTVGGIAVELDAALVTFSVPQLISAGWSINVTSNPHLTTVTAPLLASAGGLDFRHNTVLTTLSFPALTTLDCDILISENDALATLSLPMLASLGAARPGGDCGVDLEINGNPALPMCQAGAVRDELLAHGYPGRVVITGNLGTCP